MLLFQSTGETAREMSFVQRLKWNRGGCTDNIWRKTCTRNSRWKGPSVEHDVDWTGVVRWQRLKYNFRQKLSSFLYQKVITQILGAQQSVPLRMKIIKFFTKYCRSLITPNILYITPILKIAHVSARLPWSHYSENSNH